MFISIPLKSSFALCTIAQTFFCHVYHSVHLSLEFNNLRALIGGDRTCKMTNLPFALKVTRKAAQPYPLPLHRGIDIHPLLQTEHRPAPESGATPVGVAAAPRQGQQQQAPRPAEEAFCEETARLRGPYGEAVRRQTRPRGSGTPRARI